jgi:hypothetical protein
MRRSQPQPVIINAARGGRMIATCKEVSQTKPGCHRKRGTDKDEEDVGAAHVGIGVWLGTGKRS